MKLLFVGYLHGFGGAEKQLIMLSNEMAQRGHKSYLLSLSQNNPCYPIENKVNYLYKEDCFRNKLLNIIDRYFYLKKEISIIKPDLIISFNVQPAFLCSLMGNKIANKTIYSERGDPNDKEYDGINGIIRDYMVNHINGFVFQTQGACDFFSEKIKKKSIIINNPVFINPDNVSDNINSKKTIVTVGRLHEQKNQKLFIEAISNLSDKYSEYSAEIYGEGPLKNQLQKQINESETKVKISLMGAHEDVLDRIKGASLFILTSDYEGIPNALIEAMALGIPSISTDCSPGGARELIEDSVSGYIVPCGDAKLLQKRIETLIDNPEISRKMVENAKIKIKELLPNIIFDEWENFFIKKIDNRQ